jgi:hypothetical protein
MQRSEEAVIEDEKNGWDEEENKERRQKEKERTESEGRG